MTHGFLLLSPVSLTELCSFWYGLKDLFTLHKLVDKVVDITKGRKDVDSHGWFRGEWVKFTSESLERENDEYIQLGRIS